MLTSVAASAPGKLVLSGDYAVETRQALRVRHLRRGKLRREFVLLNDAVVTKSALARMIHIGLKADGEEVAVYTSDGLIVSTPTGSTGRSARLVYTGPNKAR